MQGVSFVHIDHRMRYCGKTFPTYLYLNFNLFLPTHCSCSVSSIYTAKSIYFSRHSQDLHYLFDVAASLWILSCSESMGKLSVQYLPCVEANVAASQRLSNVCFNPIRLYFLVAKQMTGIFSVHCASWWKKNGYAAPAIPLPQWSEATPAIRFLWCTVLRTKVFVCCWRVPNGRRGCLRTYYVHALHCLFANVQCTFYTNAHECCWNCVCVCPSACIDDWFEAFATS